MFAARGRSGKHKTSETAIVDQVTIVGTASKGLQRANIKTRLNRNPVIGDKFSSRHGQKGVLSVLWKDHDMPYCETTGMRYTSSSALPLYALYTVVLWVQRLALLADQMQGKPHAGVGAAVLASH